MNPAGKGVIVLFLLCLVNYCPAQTHAISRLKANLSSVANQHEKLVIILRLCEERRSLNSDTLFKYAQLAKTLAVQQRNERGIGLAENYLGFSYLKKGLYDSVLIVCQRNHARLTDKKYDDVRLHFLNLEALTLLRKKKYKESLAMYYEVLDRAEKMRDTLYQVIGLNGIGLVYKHMGKPREAIGWYFNALEVSKNPYYCEYYNAPLSNLATAYTKLERYDSAEHFIKRAIRAARKYEILDFLSGSLCELANIYIHTGRGSLAEVPLQESLKIRKELNDPVGIILDKSQLSLYYASNGNTPEGTKLALEGLQMAHEKNLDFLVPQLLESIGANYKAAGDFEKYSSVLLRLMEIKDSAFNSNSAEAMMELQQKYQAEKRDNIITQQELYITQQRFSITKKNYWLYGSGLLIFFASIAAYLVFKNYRRKQRMRMLLIIANEKQKAARAVLMAEENERKRIAADLHDSLGAYAASIASNIDHIKLPGADSSNQLAMQELKANSHSIVSQLNDTIWILNRDALSLTAISDRLKGFIQRIQYSHPSFRFDVKEAINIDHSLPPSQAFHLFQVLQEAITNAVKHSGGDEVTIVIEGGSSWSIKVINNGKSLNGKATSSTGNGIKNMKKRSTTCGWRISWEDAQPSGTTLSIAPTTN